MSLRGSENEEPRTSFNKTIVGVASKVPEGEERDDCINEGHVQDSQSAQSRGSSDWLWGGGRHRRTSAAARMAWYSFCGHKPPKGEMPRLDVPTVLENCY